MSSTKPKIYLVGGAVRDQLLGIKSKDLDYVIETSSYDEARETILSLGCKIVQEAIKYNVFRAIHPKLGGVDFALPRADFNQDGRQSETKLVSSIKEDLSRRDFTINAMAIECNQDLEPIGNLIDPFNGKEDIKSKYVKFVGNPRERIKEDELRILRAMRFCVTKDFILDYKARDVLVASKISNKVSNERIFEELNKMFAVSNLRTIIILTQNNQDYLFNRIKLKATT